MTDAEAGRRIVFYVACATIGISVAVILVCIDANGMAGLPQRLVRLTLTIALGVCLLRGEDWARMVAVVLYGAAAIGAASNFLQLVTLIPFKSAPLAFMSVVYGGSAWALLFNPSVRSFFRENP